MLQERKAAAQRLGGTEYLRQYHPLEVLDLSNPQHTQRKPAHSPDPEHWIIDKQGQINVGEDGTWIYTDWEGNTVAYPNGYPDFQTAGMVIQSVDIAVTNNRPKDFQAADSAAPLGPKQSTSTWHHKENGQTMEEINRILHSRFTHIGSVGLAN